MLNKFNINSYLGHPKKILRIKIKYILSSLEKDIYKLYYISLRIYILYKDKFNKF